MPYKTANIFFCLLLLYCKFSEHSEIHYNGPKFTPAFIDILGRAIAQAVSRWLPTTVDRVRALVWSSGIYGEQIGARAGFL
jgi:hypothetical protein